MKKTLIIFCSILIFSSAANSAPIQGNVSKAEDLGTHKIIDADTNSPIGDAEVSLPQKNYSTKTASNGTFDLNTNISSDTILSVKKEGYKPFSLTVNEQMAAKPLTVGIEKSTPMDITIETNMFHLGDNSFSELSANAHEFKVKSIGPFYTKNVKISTSNSETYLVIGSIIGIDTKMARSMGQNNIMFAYASPPEVFFNGTKIAEIQLNGDGQRIKIPRNLIRNNQNNEITIKTGRNVTQTAYIDYDDIEFMNLSIESR